MANTEIRNALRCVRGAEDAVTAALDQSNLTQQQRNLLNNLLDLLRDIDNFLVEMDLSESIDKLIMKSKKLDKLNKETQRKLSDLEEVANTVNAASAVIDALTKAFGILLSAGLL
jgi:hypothetical protein